MTDSRRFSMGDVFLLVLIVVAAAGTRAWYVNVCCRQGHDDGPFQVQDDWKTERDAVVTNLGAGRGAVAPWPLRGDEPSPYPAFAYPWLLSVLDRTSHDLDVTYQRVRWIQVGLGAITAGLYFLFARRAFRSWLVGAIAGLLCAVYPFWIINTAEVNDGVLATFLLALCLFLGVRGGQVGGALTSLLYGLGLAGLATLRAPLLPFALAAILWFLWRTRSLQRGWLYALLAFLGFVNGLVPWGMRNLQSGGGVPAVVQSAYLNLWMGNNSRATGGPESEPVMREALAEARGQEQPAQIPGAVSAEDQVREMREDMLNQVRQHPALTLERRLEAGVSFFLGQRWLNDRTLYREDPNALADAPDWLVGSVATLLAGGLLIMLLLGALGWRWTYGWKHEAMPSSLAPVWILLPYLLGHAEALHGPRLPLDGVFLCYTAFVLACAVPPVGRHLFRRTEIET
jgi:4-amino-4-deoxy-L-arabinose transferase-like glycosyltransferase